MTIKRYRYYISHGHLEGTEMEVERETDKCYHTKNGCRLLKKDDGEANIKDRTTYPYIDFFSTTDSSRENAVKSIIKFFTEKWGLK